MIYGHSSISSTLKIVHVDAFGFPFELIVVAGHQEMVTGLVIAQGHLTMILYDSDHIIVLLQGLPADTFWLTFLPFDILYA